MAAWTVKAEYLQQVLPEYQDHPLIEALPDILSASDTMKLLTKRPRYSPDERSLESKYRIHCLSRLLHEFYQPLPQHIDIETRISVCLRQGYLNRNPMGRQYVLMANESYEAMREKRQIRYIPGYHPNASGFTIIGVSGVGKSTAVESILSLYPQVIQHSLYHGEPLPVKQIVWLKLDCPHNGSLGELCYRFFKAVDDAVEPEEKIFDQYKKSRITIDSMLTNMQRLAQEYSLGMLVVDEVQHLSLAKGGSDAMLNFFVTLVNTIGVPVVLIGTSKAMPILQGEFRQARRSSGHGDLIWNRMKKGRTWITFVESMWEYQWLRDKVPLTAKMLDAFYEETQGIIVLAVILYVLIQEDAIISERETFSAEDVGGVARQRMALVQPMLDALRKNDQKLIDKYEDITDILLEEVDRRLWSDLAKTEDQKSGETRTLEKLRNEILPFFVALKYRPEEIDPYIEQAYLENKTNDTKVIMTKVFEMVKKRETSKPVQAEDKPQKQEAGYEAFANKGLVDGKDW